MRLSFGKGLSMRESRQGEICPLGGWLRIWENDIVFVFLLLRVWGMGIRRPVSLPLVLGGWIFILVLAEASARRMEIFGSLFPLSLFSGGDKYPPSDIPYASSGEMIILPPCLCFASSRKRGIFLLCPLSSSRLMMYLRPCFLLLVPFNGGGVPFVFLFAF